MERLCIKGKEFHSDRPLICIPVMEETEDAIVTEVQKWVERGADLIEWRMDAYEKAMEPSEVRSVLDRLQPLTEEVPLLLTFRTKTQGGQRDADQKQLNLIYQLAAESLAVDLVDIEYPEETECADVTEGVKETRYEDLKKFSLQQEIDALKKAGKAVVLSYHDFAQTSSAKWIRHRLEQMESLNPSIVKMALMPKSEEDVLRLMEESLHFAKAHPNRSLITMSMGELGKITRMCGNLTGSCVTFASGTAASAPGQIPYDRLRSILS